ncbi:MAG: AAA family ATPase [Candidatus Omnitrophica bacterium]|nr:AAA family ATPase [Candidatus Omnitrophota bacterium]
MFSEPAVGEKFFGREEILDLLNKRVSALKDGYRQNVALTGQSLAGKTSILQHFLHSIKEEDFITVYVEVVKEPLTSFINKFVATLLYNTLNKLGEAVSVRSDDLLDKAQRRLPKTYNAIRHINSLIDHGDIDSSYSELLGLTSIIKEEVKISCIVILDEFDNLEHLGIKNPFLGFGKVIMVQKDTMYIVSSSRKETIKRILSEKLSLLFGNFEIVKVPGFDLKTAANFIDIKLSGFEIDDPIKKFLMIFTDGNPFYLNKIASHLKSTAIEKMSSFISKEIVADTILELVYNSGGAIHQYLMNFLLEILDTRYKETHISILTSIARGRNKQAEMSRALKIKQGELSKHLASLAGAGLISKSGVFYRIDDTMLEFWLKNVYQRRKEILVDGLFNRTGLFRQDMESYLSDFLESCEQDIFAKFTDLINQFANEKIQVDSKNICLPHFTKVETRIFPDGRRAIVASFRGRSWVIRPYEKELGETDIVEYIKDIKTLNMKLSNKIVIPLKEIDEMAKLLAKELKISIWDISIANMLLSVYGKEKVAVL